MSSEFDKKLETEIVAILFQLKNTALAARCAGNTNYLKNMKRFLTPVCNGFFVEG